MNFARHVYTVIRESHFKWSDIIGGEAEDRYEEEAQCPQEGTSKLSKIIKLNWYLSRIHLMIAKKIHRINLVKIDKRCRLNLCFDQKINLFSDQTVKRDRMRTLGQPLEHSI